MRSREYSTKNPDFLNFSSTSLFAARCGDACAKSVPSYVHSCVGMMIELLLMGVNNIVSSTFNFSAEDRTTFTPESLEELLGQREPSFEDSQKDFKILAIVLTDNSLSEEEWTKVDATVKWFSNPGDDESYLYNFWEATRGNGTVTIQNN